MRGDGIVFRVRGNPVAKARKEPWMTAHDLQFTLVCGRDYEPTELERDLTILFDRELQRLYWNGGLIKEIQEVRNSSNTVVLGQVTGKRQISVQALTGTTYDGMLKEVVRQGKMPGGAIDELFKRHRGNSNDLRITGPGHEGPDITFDSTRTGWDVTTFGQLEHHFRRDVVGKEYERYYLLCYDSPGAVPSSYIDWPEDDSTEA